MWVGGGHFLPLRCPTPLACLPACPLACPPARLPLPAAIRLTQRGEEDSDDEAGVRRRRRVREQPLPALPLPLPLPAVIAAVSAAPLPCFPHLSPPACLTARPQRVPSPWGDPLEAARGGLRRGRSAASIKE